MVAPDRIGRYRILGELGQGAMGTVYRAHDDSLDREVALKVMSAGLADADSRARFLREARAAARLQHPNIVVVYELGEHEGAPFMALELLDGVDLQRGIGTGIRPDPRATLPVVLQLLAGLGHAHDHGIVHRDVKPSNVFLPRGRPAKIMDFGVARLAGLGTTTAGTVIGTPNYMSPEQVQAAADVDGRSDLFSAGLILYELVTGERAFRAETVVAIIYKILNEEPDLRLIPGGSRWERLRAVLDRALRKKRDERYPDARAMSAELMLALQDLGGSVNWMAPADQALLVKPRLAAPAPPTPQARPTPAAAAARGPLRAAPPPAAPAPWRAPRVFAGLLVVGALALFAVLGWLRWQAPAATRPTPAVAPSASASLSPAAATPAPKASPEMTAASAASSVGAPLPSAPSIAPPRPVASPSPTAAATSAAGLDPEARLTRARDLMERGRYADALAEARAVLDQQPTSREAGAIAQKAEGEVVVEDCLKNARAALKAGDRERAIEELRRGLLVNPRDERLLALHKEAVQQ